MFDTLDEAIKHCLEVAEQNEFETRIYDELNRSCDEEYRNNHCQCATDHRQLAKWLTELKEAKRLLKAAVEDVETLAKAYAEDEPCGSFTLCSECPLCIKEGCSCKEWRYKAEALKLIGDETV